MNINVNENVNEIGVIRENFAGFPAVIMRLSEITYELLQKTYGEEVIELPIRVDDVAKELGIYILKRRLIGM